MRPTWKWVVFAGLALGLGPAFGQTKIAPSHLYSNQPPAGLDKDYGLPKPVGPGPDLPQQKATTATPQEQPESFKGFATHAVPQAQTPDSPDFFRDAPGVGSPDTQASGVPNFFETASDTGLPKAQRSRSAYSTFDTPTFTTTDGLSTGAFSSDSPLSSETLPGDSAARDAMAPDGAGRP